MYLVTWIVEIGNTETGYVTVIYERFHNGLEGIICHTVKVEL